MKVFLFLIIASFLASCNAQKKDPVKTGSQGADTIPSSPMICYGYTSANDTILLNLIQVGNSITGTLVYSFKEKDRNKGTIKGNMMGNILLADYLFMSEGIQSTRQVAFKKDGNSFAEGYGDFKTLDSLSFNTSMILAEVDCP